MKRVTKTGLKSRERAGEILRPVRKHKDEQQPSNAAKIAWQKSRKRLGKEMNNSVNI